MCTGTPAHYEQTVRGRHVRPGNSMRQVCTDTPVHYEQIVSGRRVRPGRRMRRVCIGTPVQYEQTVMEGADVAGPYLQLKNTVIEGFIPPEVTHKVMRRAHWEARRSCLIPPLPRCLLYPPTLPV